MTLKEAYSYLKPFKQDGNLKTPALSDDWIIDFSSTYSNTKINIYSEKLEISVDLEVSVSYFFRKFIFSKEIILDGNKLIGEFGFYSFNLLTKEDFEEAQRLVSEKENEEPISNDELIEYGVYLDDKDNEQIYLGNFEISYFSLMIPTLDLYKKNKRSARYMIQKSTGITNYNNVIVKTSKKKFFSFVRVLSLDEILKLKKDLMSNFYCSSIVSKKGSNTIDIIKSDCNPKDYISSGFYFIDGVFGYLSKHNYYEKSVFYHIDFDLLSEDIKNDNINIKFSKYIIKDHSKNGMININLENIHTLTEVLFFSDYRYKG